MVDILSEMKDDKTPQTKVTEDENDSIFEDFIEDTEAILDKMNQIQEKEIEKLYSQYDEISMVSAANSIK